MMTFELHSIPVIQQLNFRPEGKGLNSRSAIAFLYKQGDVGMMFGVQGRGFFEAFKQHLPDVFSDVTEIYGYVPEEHVERYAAIGLDVTVLRKTTNYNTPMVFIRIMYNGH